MSIISRIIGQAPAGGQIGDKKLRKIADDSQAPAGGKYRRYKYKRNMT
jgi:hypothetical protein